MPNPCFDFLHAVVGGKFIPYTAAQVAARRAARMPCDAAASVPLDANAPYVPPTGASNAAIPPRPSIPAGVHRPASGPGVYPGNGSSGPSSFGRLAGGISGGGSSVVGGSAGYPGFAAIAGIATTAGVLGGAATYGAYRGVQWLGNSDLITISQHPRPPMRPVDHNHVTGIDVIPPSQLMPGVPTTPVPEPATWLMLAGVVSCVLLYKEVRKYAASYREH